MLVKSLLEFKELFGNGCLRRKAGHTGLNDVSSRSHGVLMVSIKNVESSTVIGKLNLIDLAGIWTNTYLASINRKYSEKTPRNS